jgi:hypothetical protein
LLIKWAIIEGGVLINGAIIEVNGRVIREGGFLAIENNWVRILGVGLLIRLAINGAIIDGVLINGGAIIEGGFLINGRVIREGGFLLNGAIILGGG